MNDQESPIHSMNVALGTPAKSSVPLSSTPHPWIVLVCSDLGFVSDRPEPLSAATINDLFAGHTVRIGGNVENGLPEDIAPFHLDYTPADVKDLSVSSFAGKLPLLLRLREASSLLDAMSARNVPVRDGLEKIAAMDLPRSVLRQLGNLISAAAPDGGRDFSGSTSSTVDSILAMMDVGTGSDRSPQTAAPDDLAALITTHSVEDVSLSGVIACRTSIDRLVGVLASVVTQQPFYREKHASWNALKTICKAAGRNRSIKLMLHSAPHDAVQHHFADVLQACTLGEGVPDLIVWDYPVTTDTAAMERLEAIGAVADRFKTIVVASLDSRDALYADAVAQKPLESVLAEPAYIPLRRLQQREAARCLSLCAPAATTAGSGSAAGLPVGGAWLLALQWLVSCIENSAPFHLQNSSVMALDNFALPKLSKETVFDGYRAGITLLRPNGVTVPRVLFGDESTPYGSMLFNLCVNRTARLAADWISADAARQSDDAAVRLQRFLAGELSPFGIGDGAVTVTADARLVAVRVDARETIAGFPVTFEFSFGNNG